MKNMTKIFLIALTFTGLCLLSGCNTMEGFGEDVEKVGDEMQEAAN